MIVQREEKKDNRGFSLVELIIVIAIMAILVAVLAPQFLKYVENSRNSADVDNAKEITNAIAAYAADAGAEGNKLYAAKNTITVTDSSCTVSDDESGKSGNKTQIENALSQAGLDIKNITAKSKTAWTGYVITVDVDGKGNVSFSYEGSSESETGIFKKKFQGGKATTTTP